MTTRDPLWNPNTRQPAGVEHWKTYLRDPLHGSVGDVLRSLFPDPCVLESAWPVVYAAGKVDVDTTATRGAIVEDADGRSRLVRPTAAAGSGEWFETLAGSAGFADVWFPDVGGVTYYVSLRYEFIPVQARSLGAPSTTGALAESRFDVYQERIGRQGVPDLVTEPIAGQLQFRLDSLIGPTLWADNPAKTRQVVIWKVVPATGGAEAVALVDGVVFGGHFIATVPHLFGQSAASLTEADYGACVLGPVVETTNPAGNNRHVLLATVTTGVVDTSGQNVVDVPSQTDDRLDEVESWVRGYQEGPADPYGLSGAGANLGGNVAMGWNLIVLTEPGGGIVKANFGLSPFASGWEWFYAQGHFLSQEDSAGVSWVDYQYSPGGAGTYCVVIAAVDETAGATQRWTAKLDTYAGTAIQALTAGRVPLVEYVWNGAAIVPPQVPFLLNTLRGERTHESVGGQTLYLAKYGAHGSMALRVESGAGATDKGMEQLHLLNDDDDDTADATVAFERFAINVDALDGHVLKVAAQANAAALSGVDFTAVQLGGTSDLSIVGQTIAGVRQIAFSHADHPAARELMVMRETGGNGFDELPLASGKRARQLAGDFHFLGLLGKHEWRDHPLLLSEGGRIWDSVIGNHRLGPWLHGSAYNNVQLATSPVGAWLYVDIDNFGAPDLEIAWVPLYFRERDFLWDAKFYITCDVATLVPTATMDWDIIKVSTSGVITVIGGAMAPAISGTNKIVQLSVDGRVTGAGAVAWVPSTHYIEMDVAYRYYARFTPGTGAGLVDWTVRRVSTEIARHEV